VEVVLPWSGELSGRAVELTIDSAVLRDNPLGDPWQRPLLVQLPPSYDEDEDTGYPVVYWLQGFLGHGGMWRNRSAFRQPFFELADQVLADPAVPPVLLVHVDAWTAFGGSQFVDSPGTGRYHSYLCEELVPFVDRHFRTLADRDHRAVAGKSSGGFGAMITPMLRPDLFGAFASHAGDALYETNYLSEIGNAVRALRDYDGDIWAFWNDFKSRDPFTKPSDQLLLLYLGISACFSTDPQGTVHLPFDPTTGRLDDAVWARWLEWDPVRMLQVPEFAQAMTSMRGIWIGAGKNDDFHLDLGARAFVDGLKNLGLSDEVINFDLVEANHWTIESRYPDSLRWLADTLRRQGT
jgi:S-formylglutathione hydrolase FrmB